LEVIANLPAAQGAHFSTRKIKVALMSCGLGRVQRGFEISTLRLFNALSKCSQVEVRLFSGAKLDGATEIFNIPRDFSLNTYLAPFTFFNQQRVWELAYGIEQVSYALFVFSELVRYKPEIVWTKETPMAHILHYARNLFGQSFKVVYANGGGFRPATYAIFDHIQQLDQASFQYAMDSGIPPERMSIIPNMVPPLDVSISREEARRFFNFTSSDWVILCVAAWNKHLKRIDFLIDEVAKLDDNSAQLLLCGHPEPDSLELKERARRKLGNRVHWYTLPQSDMPKALKAADVFVLPSTQEHFGSAAVEAIMASIPVVVHQNGSTRLLLDTSLKVTDLSVPGSIERRLKEIKDRPPSAGELSELARIAEERFSERAMIDRFIGMISALADRETDLVRMR
jgi:1,2-diacylglycerol 3-alpha-glucosyltransferase